MDIAFSPIGSLSLELNPPSSFVTGVQSAAAIAQALSPASLEVNLMAIPGPRGPVGPVGNLNADDIGDPTAYYILAKS